MKKLRRVRVCRRRVCDGRSALCFFPVPPLHSPRRTISKGIVSRRWRGFVRVVASYTSSPFYDVNKYPFARFFFLLLPDPLYIYNSHASPAAVSSTSAAWRSRINRSSHAPLSFLNRVIFRIPKRLQHDWWICRRKIGCRSLRPLMRSQHSVSHRLQECSLSLSLFIGAALYSRVSCSPTPGPPTYIYCYPRALQK